MQKIINVIAVSSGIVSLAIVVGGVSVYVSRDAIIDGIKSQIMGSVTKSDATDNSEMDIETDTEDSPIQQKTGKDLLSDASGDGQLTSVPEVLGKQIARIDQDDLDK